MDSNTPLPNSREVQVEAFDRSAQAVAPVSPSATATPPPLHHRPQRRRRSPRWFVWLMGFLLAVVLLGLLACALVGGLIMGIALKLANEVSASVTSTQMFTVAGVPSLDIHNASGSLSVLTGAPGSVSVEMTRTARDSSQSAARTDLDKIAVTASQDGNRITVTSDFQDESFFATSSAVNLRIVVPPTANIAADVTAGDFRVDGVSGLIELTGGAGNATLRNVSPADGSRIHVATGSVTVQGSVPPGASIDIAVNTGDVTLKLPADTRTRLDARTTIGDIHINGWQVQPTRTNRVGAMTNDILGAQPEGTIHIRVDSGDISVSQL